MAAATPTPDSWKENLIQDPDNLLTCPDQLGKIAKQSDADMCVASINALQSYFTESVLAFRKTLREKFKCESQLV